MARTKEVRPSKSQEKKAAAPIVPEPEPEPDTSPMSDVPSNFGLDDDFSNVNFGEEPEEQGASQAFDDMDIDWDDDVEEEAEETKEELLSQINKNWNISSLRSIMTPLYDEKEKKQLKDTWLSGKTDLEDKDWDMATLRLFRDLSRLTRNDFDDAKSRLAKTLRYRKHDEHGKRTGSQRVIKEPRLRNDLRAVISALHTKKRKERDEKDGESGKPKKKKAKTDDSSDVDLDDNLYKPEEEISFEEYQKRIAKSKGSSKTPGGKGANRSKSRQDSEDESSSGPDEIPPTDPRTKKNAEAGVKVKKKPARPEKNAQAKANAAETEAADGGSSANEPPPVTIIQNEEQRNAAIEYIYLIWGAGSLLYTLPDALRPAEATKDQDLAYEIVAALRNLSNVIRTPDELAAFRQDLQAQVAGDTSYTNEDIVAHIARVGEPYYHAARAAGEVSRLSAVQSAAGQLQTEGPTTRRSPRNHNASAIPPADGQQAAAAPALDLLAAVAAGRPRVIATTLQPPQRKQPPAAKPNAGNEGTTQQSDRPTTQEDASPNKDAASSSTAANLLVSDQPPQPQLQPAEQRPSRPTAAIQDSDVTFRLVSALSRVRNTEADVRVAQIQRDIAALRGQPALDIAEAYLEVALREQERARAEMEANSFQGNREGMQTREEVVRQREQELRRIRRGDGVDTGDKVEDEEDEEDGESHQRTKRRKTGDGGKSGDEGDMSGEGNRQGEPK